MYRRIHVFHPLMWLCTVIRACDSSINWNHSSYQTPTAAQNCCWCESYAVLPPRLQGLTGIAVGSYTITTTPKELCFTVGQPQQTNRSHLKQGADICVVWRDSNAWPLVAEGSDYFD